MTSLAGGTKSKKEDEPNKKVVLKREDVTVIVIPLQSSYLTFQMNEFEISKTAAEKALRQNHGELKATIHELINV
jgi:hypothetical protein